MPLIKRLKSLAVIFAVIFAVILAVIQLLIPYVSTKANICMSALTSKQIAS